MRNSQTEDKNGGFMDTKNVTHQETASSQWGVVKNYVCHFQALNFKNISSVFPLFFPFNGQLESYVFQME